MSALALVGAKRGAAAVAACSRGVHVYAPPPPPEYTDRPNYPEILDNSSDAKYRRRIADQFERFRAIETVEEKLYKLNMPRFYGWFHYSTSEEVPLGALPFVQHATRTHLAELRPSEGSNVDRLPPTYLPYESAAGYIAKQLRPFVEDALYAEYHGLKRNFEFDIKKDEQKQREQIITKSVVKQINRLIMNYLSLDAPHLLSSQVDIEPRHEAFWFVGEIERRQTSEDLMKKNLRPKDRPIQYKGDPILTLRNSLPLEPVCPYEDSQNSEFDVPLYKYDPSTVGLRIDRKRATNIPGFWPGDSGEFGLISYHTRHHIADSYYSEESKVKLLHTQAILASFSWLLVQACYQGFSLYNDITYPLVTQTVITNGQLWSFYTYQLNTILVSRDNPVNNPKKNICYCTKPMKLFEGFDADGKVIDFNEDVLRTLIQFYLNMPKERENTEMKPYLGKDIKVIADIPEDERRIWLEENYKYLVSNRPPHRLPYEVYLWQYIYKIKFQTRPLEKKRMPFELFLKNPNHRRLDEHALRYIPKAFRKPGFKKIVKWEKTYYP